MLDTFRGWVSRKITPKNTGAKMFGAANFIPFVPITKLGEYSSYLQAGTKKLWAQWKAADLCADAVSSTPINVMRGNSITTVDPLSRLLNEPNVDMTIHELIYLSIMHLKFVGNAFFVKCILNRNGVVAPTESKPTSIWPLNPKRVSIVTDTNGSVTSYRLSLGSGGNYVTLPKASVMHVKRPHPNNDFWGIGEMEAGESLLQETVNSVDWIKNFWDNGAAPSAVLVESGDSPVREDDWRKLKTAFREEITGRNNTGKIAFMQGKWELLKIGLSMEEMQSIDGQKWSVEQIFMLNGVPLTMVGYKEAGNYATAQLDEIKFRKYTVRPLCRNLAETFTSDLAKLFGDQFRIEFDLQTLEFLEGVMAGASPAFDRGAITRNELRMLLGFQRVDDPEYDRAYLLSTYIPAEFAGTAISDIAAAITGRQIQSGQRSLEHTSPLGITPDRDGRNGRLITR